MYSWFSGNFQICGECGKGFYRKDHLRKHTKSHQTKRLKEEMNAQAQAQKAAANSNKGNNIVTTSHITSIPMTTVASNTINTNAIKTEITTTNCSADDFLQQIQQQQQVLQLQSDCQTICLHVSVKKNYILHKQDLISNSNQYRCPQVTTQPFPFK